MYERLNLLIFVAISTLTKPIEFEFFKEKKMFIVHKMNVVVTRSPFEAARSKVYIFEAIGAEIICNKLDYIDWKHIRKNSFLNFLIDRDVNRIS